MDENNKSIIAMLEPQYLWLKRLGIYGRIGSLRYMAWLAGSFTLLTGLFIIILMASSKQYIPFSFFSEINLISGYLILLVVSFMVITMKRIQDFGGSAWCILLLFIPVINFFAFIAFIIVSGDKNSNRYGSTPSVLSIIEVLFVGWFFCLATAVIVLFGVFVMLF